MENLKIFLNTNPKKKPQANTELGFGKKFTDHMFTMVYKEGKGWHDAKIQPYAQIAFDPATAVFHYAQGIFEGLKAYKNENNEVLLFRPEENFKRLNEAAARMCIPQFDEKFALEALCKLLEIEKDWIPTAEGTSLYIRPSIIATNVELGVHPSREYLFFIILSPVGAYYQNGLEPVKLLVEDTFVRAAVGGTGAVKAIGNYGASLKAMEKAIQANCDQVLWLDAKEHRFIEEVGSMNIFFVIDGVVITPALTGSILPGITRKSCIELLHALGYDVEEKNISIEELLFAQQEGRLTEMFGAGTAAVISPVGSIRYRGKTYTIGDGSMGKVAEFLYYTLTAIQYGKIEDSFGWSYNIQNRDTTIANPSHFEDVIEESEEKEDAAPVEAEMEKVATPIYEEAVQEVVEEVPAPVVEEVVETPVAAIEEKVIQPRIPQVVEEEEVVELEQPVQEVVEETPAPVVEEVVETPVAAIEEKAIEPRMPQVVEEDEIMEYEEPIQEVVEETPAPVVEEVVETPVAAVQEKVIQPRMPQMVEDDEFAEYEELEEVERPTPVVEKVVPTPAAVEEAKVKATPVVNKVEETPVKFVPRKYDDEFDDYDEEL